MEKIVIKTREFFEKNCKDLDLHMVGQFPINSCETSSLVLGKVLFKAFPDKNIDFVEGYNFEKDERHFWIEADGLTFDITADQFDGINKPLFGTPNKLISKMFESVERFPISEQLSINSFATSKKVEITQVVNEILSRT